MIEYETLPVEQVSSTCSRILLRPVQTFNEVPLLSLKGVADVLLIKNRGVAGLIIKHRRKPIIGKTSFVLRQNDHTPKNLKIVCHASLFLAYDMASLAVFMELPSFPMPSDTLAV